MCVSREIFGCDPVSTVNPFACRLLIALVYARLLPVVPQPLQEVAGGWKKKVSKDRSGVLNHEGGRHFKPDFKYSLKF